MRLAKSAKSAGVGYADVHYRLLKAKSEGFKSTAANAANAANACNNTIKTPSEHSDFIFFGCWNNINCEEEYIYRDIVLDYISLHENAIKQLYIAGDNWYQNKRMIDGDNFKVYLTDVLITGYAKLYAMNKEVYIAVGNHDEDKDGLPDNKLLKRGCSINTQKYYLKHIKDGKLSASQPTLEGLYLLANGNQLTDNYMCENGVYIYVDNIGVRYNNGNIVIIINTNRFDDYESGLKYIRSIQAVIRRVNNMKGDEQIFVMGHVPMFSFKKDVIKPEKINDEIIVGLFNIFAKHNIIYICADTHNFSIMKIHLGNKVVIQITAGTGGADPDLLQIEYANTAKKCDVETVKTVKRVFHIEAFALNPYGYVSIKTERVKSVKSVKSGTSITVCYKKIDVNTVNIFTYSFDMDTKIIEPSTTFRATKASPSISYKTVGHKVCSSIPPSSDYITSIKPNVLCYKKKIIKKEKSSKVI
jgi:uncharacterized membrane protein YccF (DUF307 family)